MKKKKIHITSTGSTIMFILVGIFLYNIINGLVLNFSGLNQQSLLSRFSEIHFSSPGNDFGGGIFWLTTNSLNEPKTITLNGESKICHKQLRGIYYNAARGSRLWPLDIETLELLSKTGAGYEHLSINTGGGFYTSCEGLDNQYSIFGFIEYDWLGTKSSIIGGTKLNYTNNSYIPEFANNFQYFNNLTPLGYFWDSVGGIGFIGGALSGSENLLEYLNNSGTINDSFGNSNSSGNWNLTPSSGNAQDTMWNMIIQGNVILSKAIDVNEKKAFLGNLEKRTILVNSDINSAIIVNTAKKNAEILCRGKTYLEGTTLPTNSNEKTLCYNGTNNLEIDLTESASYKDKTIIMKNGNISIKNSMIKDSPALDIFIDEGNLYIENNPAQKTNFNDEGYPSETSVSNSGIFIKGSLIINGLLLGGAPDSETQIENKLHLLGRIAFLNTPTTPSQGRIGQVESILSDTSYSSWISLENVFGWSCYFNGTATDGTSCLGNTSAVVTPFVVLNANYPSKILQ